LIAKKAIPGLESPRIGPSPMGAVALQWDFDDVTLVVRISSGQPDRVHFQEEGPDFQAGQDCRESCIELRFPRENALAAETSAL
jgi:hypothetical protein